MMAGDRIVVIDGEHAGRFGRVMLTHDSDHHRLVVRMLRLTPERVHVALDRTELGGWSGVLPHTSVKPTRPENDFEFYDRVEDVYLQLGILLDRARRVGGLTLDDAARQLGLKRQEIAQPIPALMPR